MQLYELYIMLRSAYQATPVDNSASAVCPCLECYGDPAGFRARGELQHALLPSCLSHDKTALGLCAPPSGLLHLFRSVPHNFRLQSWSLQVCRGVSGALRYFTLSTTLRFGKRNNELIAWRGLAFGQKAVFATIKNDPKAKSSFLLAAFGSIGTRQIADGQWLGQITGDCQFIPRL